MPIEIVTSFTRPSGSVEFYRPDLDFMAFKMKKYVDTGKISDQAKSMSEDGLTKTYTTIFAFKECYAEYFNDPKVKEYREKLNEHNRLNKITTTFTKRRI